MCMFFQFILITFREKFIGNLNVSKTDKMKLFSVANLRPILQVFTILISSQKLANHRFVKFKKFCYELRYCFLAVYQVETPGLETGRAGRRRESGNRRNDKASPWVESRFLRRTFHVAQTWHRILRSDGRNFRSKPKPSSSGEKILLRRNTLFDF